MSQLERVEYQLQIEQTNFNASLMMTMTEICFKKCKKTFYSPDLALPDQQCIKACVKKFNEAMNETNRLAFERLQKTQQTIRTQQAELNGEQH